MMPNLVAGAARKAALAFAFMGIACTAAAAPDLVLRYDRPAQDNDQGWEKEALPIGNGRIGAMVFGGLAREHLEFNDITLWSGDARQTGTYQPFGDVIVDLPGHDADARDYRRTLDLAHAIHAVTYTHGGVRFQREVLASHPAQVIVLRLTADKPGQYTGSIALTDRHGAHRSGAGKSLYAAGTLAGWTLPNEAPTTNTLDYASQVRVVNEGGKVAVESGRIVFTGCDALTVIVGAGTSYVADAARRFQGGSPRARVLSAREFARVF